MKNVQLLWEGSIVNFTPFNDGLINDLHERVQRLEHTSFPNHVHQNTRRKACIEGRQTTDYTLPAPPRLLYPPVVVQLLLELAWLDEDQDQTHCCSRAASLAT